ncbi:MAG TPA: response regulator [Kiritimatiellia bacterium]|nr:response regulator [Kiritimatiellia bacterium]
MRRKVLLIEDNEQNRYLTEFLLNQRGYEIVSAFDGPRGIELARTIKPDIILLDIQLPNMDGYQVAQSLRLIDSLRAVPIIAVTSYAMVGDREKAMEAGCTGYIEKPINPDTFVDEVERHT